MGAGPQRPLPSPHSQIIGAWCDGGPRTLAASRGESAVATNAPVATEVTKPPAMTPTKAASSRAGSDGITRGRVIRPGANMAASHARKSRHAGAKNLSSASAVSWRHALMAQSMPKPDNIPTMEAGKEMPLRQLKCPQDFATREALQRQGRRRPRWAVAPHPSAAYG